MLALVIQSDSWTCQVFLILSRLAWSSNMICGLMIAIAMQWERAPPPPLPLLPVKNTCEYFNCASSYYISCWHWVPYLLTFSLQQVLIEHIRTKGIHSISDVKIDVLRPSSY